jgi:hypothetical protein
MQSDALIVLGNLHDDTIVLGLNLDWESQEINALTLLVVNVSLSSN